MCKCFFFQLVMFDCRRVDEICRIQFYPILRFSGRLNLFCILEGYYALNILETQSRPSSVGCWAGILHALGGYDPTILVPENSPFIDDLYVYIDILKP